jgi:hypothetical protein
MNVYTDLSSTSGVLWKPEQCTMCKSARRKKLNLVANALSVDTTGGAFHGSLVANNLSVQGSSTFYYDPRRTNPTGGGPGSAGPGYTPATNSASASSLYVLSAQEQTTGAP